MPEIAADLQTACSDLFFGAEIERLQPLGPDADLPRARTRAREANGRFAIGHSGNPKGRPRGIRQPRRRPLGLLLRQAKPGTLGPLIERKPYLCLPVLRLVLPPVHAADPGDLLRIDFSRMGDAAEIADAIGQVLQAVSRGKISPGEGARLVRRARKPLRKIRRALWHKKRMEGQIEPRRRSN